MAQIKYLSEDGVLFLLKDLLARFKEKADMNHTHADATGASAGFMSAKDKAKLDGIAEGATSLQIAAEISESSTDAEAASAKAVYDYVRNALSGIGDLSVQIVEESLPESGENGVIYLVPKAAGEERNTYDEYMWINESWELIGTTGVDLTGYLKEADVIALTNAEITSLITQAGG